MNWRTVAVLPVLVLLFGGAVGLAATAPLSGSDLDLYLSVMRQAADRVQHPTAEDKRVLAEADALTKNANSGGPVMLTEEQSEDIARAITLRTQMDEIVAGGRHLDTDRYDAIRDRIEEEVGELYCDPNADVPDRVLLKPRVTEIGRLMRSVRGLGGGLVCASGG